MDTQIKKCWTKYSKENWATYKYNYTQWPSGVYSRYAKLVQYPNPPPQTKDNVIYHTDRLENKNHIPTSAEEDKASDKIQNPFIIKTQKTMNTKEIQLNIKHPQKPTTNITLNGERLNASF